MRKKRSLDATPEYVAIIEDIGALPEPKSRENMIETILEEVNSESCTTGTDEQREAVRRAVGSNTRRR